MSEDKATRKVAVVTGGSAGIGRAVVRELARGGYDVAILARGEDGLRGAAREVEAAGQRVLPIPTDVSDHRAVDAAAEQVREELGPIDLWVNDAFTGAIAFFEDVTPEEFERITAVTYIGYVNGTRAALRHMVPQGRGTIVQVGSALAFRGIPLQSAYCGAKHAIKGFTESVRTELKHKRSPVQLCEVHLPAVNTPQFGWVLSRGIDAHPQPVPPIFQPEVAARMIAHVAEHPRRVTWVGVPTALTILGNRVAPALLDRYLARTNVDAQQAPQHGKAPERSNTWEPAPGDAGAHGSFDQEAYSYDVTVWANRHRRALLAGALCGIGAMLVRARS